MSEGVRLDPRLEELLREIAAEPRSNLLRVPRAPSPKSLFERSPRVGVAAPGLTSAEQHLLAVHRHELAWLAKEACKWRLAHDPRSRPWLGRTLGQGAETRLLDREELRAHLDELRSASIDDPRPDFVRRIERCIAPEGEFADAEQLASASLRLQHDDSTRICLALSLVTTGRAPRAVELLRGMLAAPCPRKLQPYALINLGFAWDVQGRTTNALHAFEHAANREGDSPVAVLYLLLVAIRLQDRRRVEHQLDRLQDWQIQDEFEQLLAEVACRRRVEAWRPSPAQIALVESSARTPELAQRVIHAIL